MYFSPVVGGYAAVKDKFETDYWGACQTLALEWLIAHSSEYPARHAPPTVAGLFGYQAQFPSGVHLSPDIDAKPDFFIDSAYIKSPPGYTKVHAIKRVGTEVCTVSVRR
jgi:hypothetical protein